MPEKENKIPPKIRIRQWDIFRVFLRSFFVQSMWNYRSLISVGFGICLLPILRRLHTDTEARKAFMDRHLKYFNAHPYMASYALGVSIHLEEVIAAGDKDAPKKLLRMKELLVGILGATGDQLFWSNIKPFSLVIGVSLLMLTVNPPMMLAMLAFTFLLYNIPHIYFRYNGLQEGYRYGMNIYQKLNEQRFQRLKNSYFFSGTCAFLLFLAILITKLIKVGWLELSVMLGALVVAVFLYRFTRKFYLTAAVIFILGILSGFIVYGV